MQVYKNLDIGTAKITPDEMDGYKALYDRYLTSSAKIFCC